MTQDARITPETIAAEWRVAPTACAWPGRKPGLCAAVFARPGGTALDLASPCDPTTHVLTVELRPCRIAFSVDGRVVADGTVARDAVQIVRAGEAPFARVTSAWRIIQFYIPVADLTRLAVEMGAGEATSRGLELLDPGFAIDPALARTGRRLDQRLRKGDVPSRLELDEIALEMGEHLVRRHSNIALAEAQEAAPLSERELALLKALLLDGLDPGLDDVAALLDRPVSDAERAFRAAFKQAPWPVQRSLTRTKPS